MSQYVSRPQVVEAIRWTGENIDEEKRLLAVELTQLEAATRR